MPMIRICHININSIDKHKDELLARFSNYDVISVNETNLKSKRRFSLWGYNVFRNDRVGKSGGEVLLAIKHHIKCREVYNKTTNANEAIAVEIETHSFKSIVSTIIIYGYPVLLTADQRIWSRLQIMQNKALRAALGLPIYTSTKYIHQISHVSTIKEYATGLLQKAIQTATMNNDNTLRTHLQDIFDQI